MNPVVHFEMPYEDATRMSKFYASAFGWETNQLGPEYGNYMMTMTTESDQRGPKNPGAINGGFYEKKSDFPMQYPSVVIAVEDVQAAMRKVAAAGGKVLGEPMQIPNVGLYVSFIDTEGNRASMMQFTASQDCAHGQAG